MNATTHMLAEPRAAAWLRAWLLRPLASAPADFDAEGLIQEMSISIQRYESWCASGGPVALYNYARRRAGWDQDRGAAAASDTYLDVRARLEATVPRALAGRSLPHFPSVDAVARYHRLQVKLRLEGRWRRRRVWLALDEERVYATEEVTREVQLSQLTLPLRFAACWMLIDFKPTAQKDLDWWWSALRHGLDIEKLDALAGERNDPTEAVLRLTSRLAACVAMRPTLQRWVADHPAWRDLSLALPSERPTEDALAPVREALAALRPRLALGIHSLDIPTEEAEFLLAALVRGVTLRTRLRALQGGSASERKERLRELAAAAGQAAMVEQQATSRRAA